MLKVIILDDYVGLEFNFNGNVLFNYEYNVEVYVVSYVKVY